MSDVERTMLKDVLHLKRKHKEAEEILVLCEKRARYDIPSFPHAYRPAPPLRAKPWANLRTLLC